MILNRTLTHPKSQIYTEPAGAVREASEPRSPLRSVRPYALVTAAVYAFSSIPYVFGYLSQNNGMAFTWIVFDVVDTAQYFAWMRSFSDSVLIANPLTPEPGESRFFNLQWWFLGLLAFKLPLGAELVYQILRVVALVAFAGAVGWFCKLVLPQRAFLAFLLVMTASGLGWIWIVEKQWSGDLRHPLDVQVAEANTFFSAMAFPHLLVAAAMMVSIFCFCLKATQERFWLYCSLAFVTTLALGFSHGYDLIPTMVVPCATALLLFVRRSRIPRLAWPAGVVVIAAAPGALYALALTRLDETWSGVLSQYGNAGVFTPLPHHLAVLLGVPLLLALPQIRPSAWRGLDERQLFVRVWLVAGFFLLYIPTDYQIKMLIAYQVPICILAAQTLDDLRVPGWFSAGVPKKLPAIALAATVAFFMLTNIYLMAWRVIDLDRQEYPYFMADTDIAALRSLESHVQPGQVVLSSEQLGVFVPVYSDGRPFLAHWAQTLDFFARREATREFYQSSTSAAERLELINENNIVFVIFGPAEARLAERPSYHQLEQEFELLLNGQTRLYRTSVAAEIEACQ